MKSIRSQIMIGIMISLFLLAGTSDTLFSKTTGSSDPGEFLIRFETTDKGVRLTAHQGCAFKEVNLTLKDSARKTVDQYGKVSFVRFSTKGIEKEGLADFRIAVMKTENGFYLEGINGTEWREISVNYPEEVEYHFIHQQGISENPGSSAKMD